MVTFVSGGGSLPPGAPGVVFPSLAELEGPAGLTAGLAAAANMFGVVTLSCWAVATATDYGTGLIRLLVAAEPRRWPLLAGKVGALLLVTAAATTVAALVNVLAVLPAAQAAGISTAAWGTDPIGVVASAWTSLFLALCVWGIRGGRRDPLGCGVDRDRGRIRAGGRGHGQDGRGRSVRLAARHDPGGRGQRRHRSGPLRDGTCARGRLCDPRPRRRRPRAGPTRRDRLSRGGAEEPRGRE